MTGARSVIEVPPPGDVLACGVEVDRVVDQVQAGRARELDAHQATCAYCRPALRHYEQLFAPVRDLAATPVFAPRGAVDVAIARLRGGEVDPWVLDVGRGRTRLGQRALLALARRAAETVPGVRVALARLERAGEGDVSVEVTLAAALGTVLPVLGTRVREAVRSHIRAETGLRAVVSVHVDTVVS